jgi:hypothetical protein
MTTATPKIQRDVMTTAWEIIKSELKSIALNIREKLSIALKKSWETHKKATKIKKERVIPKATPKANKAKVIIENELAKVPVRSDVREYVASMELKGGRVIGKIKKNREFVVGELLEMVKLDSYGRKNISYYTVESSGFKLLLDGVKAWEMIEMDTLIKAYLLGDRDVFSRYAKYGR